MKKNDEEIKAIIDSSQKVPDWVAEARKYNICLEALIDGYKFEDELYRIEHKEDEKQLLARKRYSHSIKDVFSRVLRPLDNIYSATGGSKDYGSSVDESQRYDEEKLISKISKIRNKQSLEKWLQRNWMKVYHTDPNGIIFYEYLKEKFYPTYKNISSIRNYETDGQQLEWILFEPKMNADRSITWRYVDDARDVIITQNAGKNSTYVLTIDESKTLNNAFRICPGLVNSDIQVIGSEKRLSPIDNVIELAKESLRDNSQKSMYKFLLWNPIFWRYALQCPTCHGSGNTASGDNVCGMCNGTKIYASKDITDAILIGIPDDKEQQILTPNIAGFVVPPVEIIEEFNKEIDRLEDCIYATIWGTANFNKILQSNASPGDGTEKTATEIMYDTAPQISRLNDYADVAEMMEEALSELAANFIFQTKAEDKEICSIHYGRNYIIEPLNVLADRYQTSRLQGVTTSILDTQLYELLCSKFKNDPLRLEEELKRIQVEPFVHFTANEVKDIYSQDDAKKKMLFQKWWAVEADRTKDVEVLIDEFDEYCEKILVTTSGEPEILGKIKKTKLKDGTFKYYDSESNEEITDTGMIKNYEDAVSNYKGNKYIASIQVQDDPGLGVSVH